MARYFYRLDIFLNPIVVRTSRTGKGGVSTYGKIQNQVRRKCKEDSTAWVTTLLDYYGLPSDFPGQKDSTQSSESVEKAKYVERAFQEDIGCDNFIANLMIHEFESLLYSHPDSFESWFDQDVVEKIRCDSQSFETPEHINNDPSTAPSKRILKHCPQYEKIFHGSAISLDIGLDIIKKECPHFRNWLTTLEAL